MRLSLSELMCVDFAELANYNSDYIASEESIRFLAAMFKKEGLLNDVYIVQLDKLEALLSEKLEKQSLANTKGHYQFLIEVGSRSKISQRHPDTIHYCSIDLFTSPSQKPLAFVADQYRGHDGYYPSLKTIASNLGIHFAVPGVGVFQADSVHCPIYSLNHLLLTANDPAIEPLLNDIVGDTSEKTHTLFNWDQLPPNYVVSSQSVSMLLKYIDSTKAKEERPSTEPSAVLMASDFSKILNNGLYPDFRMDNKIRSKVVRKLAASMAGRAVVQLEQPDAFSESSLIDICYKDSYPAVHEMLSKALQISQEHPYFAKGHPQPHPIFKLAFYHGKPLETCFQNDKFKAIFGNSSILLLMQQELLDPNFIFKTITRAEAPIIVPKKAECNVHFSNITAMEILANCLDKHPEANLQNTSTLFAGGKTRAFFNNAILTNLFINGLIKIDHVIQIEPYRIDTKIFNALTTNLGRLTYLKEKFNLDIPLPMESSNEIFHVPMPNSPTSTNATQKPDINIRLVIQSMSKSVFIPQPPVTEKVREEDAHKVTC